MRNNNRVIISVLVSVSLLATTVTGCSSLVSGITFDGNTYPFGTDRVATIRILMPEEDWIYCQDNALLEQYVKADFWFDDKLVPDVAVRPKGNSSLKTAVNSNSIRFSLKVDFNFFNSARTFYGLKKINLNNGFSDPTMIREVLGYELFEQMDIPTPRTAFVDLWVNDTHLGVYTMVEQIDQTFLENNFPDATGNLYKPETRAAALNWTEADLGDMDEYYAEFEEDEINLGGGKLSEIMQALGQEDFMQETTQRPWADLPQQNEVKAGAPATSEYFYLEQMGLKTNENNPDHSALLHLLEVLNNEPDETFPEEIEKILDVDEVLRFIAVSAAIVHLDNYIGSGHNYYLYEIDGKFTVIPWDLNMVFGTFNYGIDRNQLVNFYIDEPTAGAFADRPLVARLLSYQPYLDKYHDYLEEFLDGPFTVAKMNTRIDELGDLIRPYVIDDEMKFFSDQQFEVGLSGDINFTGRIPGGMSPVGLKTFIKERIISIREQLEGKRDSSSGNGSGNGGRWMMDGQFERRDQAPRVLPIRP